MSNSNSNINNRFAPVRRPTLHTITVDRRQEHFNGTSLMAYIRTELVKYLWGKRLKNPVNGETLTEDQFLKIAREIATKHPTFLERLWTYSKGFGGEYESHASDVSTLYTRALVDAYIDKSWRKLANVQRILLVAAEALNLSDRRTREDYMLIPDVYDRYQVAPDIGGYIFGLSRDTLKARYPNKTVTIRGSTYHGNNPLILISRRSTRNAGTNIWTQIAEYLSNTVSRGQNKTIHKDFEYLLKHNGIFLPEVLIELGTMREEKEITTNTFETIQNILKRGITPNRKIQSERVEHYVSQIALHFEMKPIIKHVNMRDCMTPLLSEMMNEMILSMTNDEMILKGTYYRALLYPDQKLTGERFEFFKWLIKYIKPSTSDDIVHNTVKTIFLLTGHPPSPDQFPHVTTPVLMDFIKWCVNNVGDQNLVSLFEDVVQFAKYAEPGSMYDSEQQMVEVIKYLRNVSTRKGLGPLLQRHVHVHVTNMSDQNTKAWIKHAVGKFKAPKKVSQLDPKKLRQQTILHPEANGEDVATMERVPLNKAVTLRGHDHNGKIRYIFNRNTVQNLMKNYRWYNNTGRTAVNTGRGTHPVTRQSFYRENVVPLESRLSNQDRQLYKMLLHKNNMGGNRHEKINSVLKHLEEQWAAKKAARKKKTNTKRKRITNNSTKPNNKGKAVRINSSINLTKTNSNATNSRGMR